MHSQNSIENGSVLIRISPTYGIANRFHLLKLFSIILPIEQPFTKTMLNIIKTYDTKNSHNPNSKFANAGETKQVSQVKPKKY